MDYEKKGSLPQSRRQFIKNLACAASSAAVSSLKPLSVQGTGAHRIKKGDMYYRRLGRTNLFVSEISLGGSPIPEDPILYKAFERGVNYIDTSHDYMNGNSERKIGKLCTDVGRGNIYVATKFHIRGKWDAQSIIDSVNGSLQRLKSDYIDVLLIHGAENEADLTEEKVISAFEKLKKEGKYRFRGLSCHSNHHRVVKRAVECGYYDMIQLAYNVFDIQEAERDIKVYDDYLGESGIRHIISLAHSKDVGIIAMKTLKVGGKRQNLDRYKTGTTSLLQAMLKWVLENENVTSAVTEMLSFEQLEEDLSAVGNPLSASERKNLFRFVAENSHNYCHLCGLCQSSCPARVKTTTILQVLAYYENYGKEIAAKRAYAQLKPHHTALSCLNCGECERECPYRVSVRMRIREAQRVLSA